MNWGRNTVGMVPLVWLGSLAFGAQGVLIGQGLAGVAFGCLSWLLARRVIAQGGQSTTKGKFDREGRLMSLLHLRK